MRHARTVSRMSRVWPPSTVARTRSGSSSPTSPESFDGTPGAARHLPRAARGAARARASTPPACWTRRRWSAPASRWPTTRPCCAARASSACGWWRRAPRATPRNRDDFFGMVRATLGVDAEVISGRRGGAAVVRGRGGRARPVGRPVRGGRHGRRLHGAGGRRPDRRTGRPCAPPTPPTSAACASPSAASRATRRSAAEVAAARDLAASVLADAFAAVPVEGVRTWVGRRGHDHHALRVRPAAAGLRPDRGAPLPALGRRTCTASPRNCSA